MVESPMCQMPGSLKENLLVAVVVQYQKKCLMRVVQYVLPEVDMMKMERRSPSHKH